MMNIAADRLYANCPELKQANCPELEASNRLKEKSIKKAVHA